jgi:hypothetical protein
MENHFIYTYQLRVLKETRGFVRNQTLERSVAFIFVSPRCCKMQHVANAISVGGRGYQ